MNTTYQTLIVKFSEPITALDGIFDEAQAWGTNTLKGWIDDYESTRFTATDSHTAVITSEYNMECVKEFAEKHELDKFFLYGFGSHHFYLHQRYTSNLEMVMKNRVLSVHF